jgi:predicted nucleic-acid-binding protein
VISLDTNVLVRVIVGDDQRQQEVAVEVLKSDRLWLAKTVLVELEWVLRYSYELPREAIEHALRTLLGLRTLTVEDRTAVVAALEAYAGEMDFADALHLASSASADRFVTFDKRLAANAAGSSLCEVALLTTSR